MVAAGNNPSKPAHSRKQRDVGEASVPYVSRSFLAPARDTGSKVPTFPAGIYAASAVLIELMFARFAGLRKTALADKSSVKDESMYMKRIYPSLCGVF